MNLFLNKTNQFLIKHINLITFSFLLFGISFWIYGFMHSFEGWGFIHQTIYVVLFFSSIFLLVGLPTTPITILISFFVSMLPITRNILHIISQWFFFESPIKQYFHRIAVKDLNVFIALMMLILIIWAICKGVIQYKKRAYFLTSFFTALVLSSVLFITAVIHYAVIEFGYVNYLKLEKEHMISTFNIQDEKEFLSACEREKYICYFNKSAISLIEETTDENFKKFLQSNQNLHNSQIVILGNFPINSLRNIYMIASYENKWVIEPLKATRFFRKSELVLTSLLSFAHGFWMIFYFWLVLSHQKRRSLN